ncbi:hypothetical protein RCL1_000024 [Eukaryota sp. TZLM3-RCL]
MHLLSKLVHCVTKDPYSRSHMHLLDNLFTYRPCKPPCLRSYLSCPNYLLSSLLFIPNLSLIQSELSPLITQLSSTTTSAHSLLVLLFNISPFFSSIPCSCSPSISVPPLSLSKTFLPCSRFFEVNQLFQDLVFSCSKPTKTYFSVQIFANFVEELQSMFLNFLGNFHHNQVYSEIILSKFFNFLSTFGPEFVEIITKISSQNFTPVLSQELWFIETISNHVFLYFFLSSTLKIQLKSLFKMTVSFLFETNSNINVNFLELFDHSSGIPKSFCLFGISLENLKKCLELINCSNSASSEEICRLQSFLIENFEKILMCAFSSNENFDLIIHYFSSIEDYFSHIPVVASKNSNENFVNEIIHDLSIKKDINYDGLIKYFNQKSRYFDLSIQILQSKILSKISALRDLSGENFESNFDSSLDSSDLLELESRINCAFGENFCENLSSVIENVSENEEVQDSFLMKILTKISVLVSNDFVFSCDTIANFCTRFSMISEKMSNLTGLIIQSYPFLSSFLSDVKSIVFLMESDFSLNFSRNTVTFFNSNFLQLINPTSEILTRKFDSIFRFSVSQSSFRPSVVVGLLCREVQSLKMIDLLQSFSIVFDLPKSYATLFDFLFPSFFLNLCSSIFSSLTILSIFQQHLSILSTRLCFIVRTSEGVKPTKDSLFFHHKISLLIFKLNSFFSNVFSFIRVGILQHHFFNYNDQVKVVLNSLQLQQSLFDLFSSIKFDWDNFHDNFLTKFLIFSDSLIKLNTIVNTLSFNSSFETLNNHFNLIEEVDTEFQNFKQNISSFDFFF